MKYNFKPDGRVASSLGKVGTLRFTNTKSNRDNQVWVKDVLNVFAEKASLTFSQAVQIIKSSDFGPARQIHMRRGLSLPEKITQINDRGEPVKVMNPLRIKLINYGEMAAHDHVAMMAEHLSFASSLRHAQDRTSGMRKSEPDFNKMTASARKNLRHPDELLSSHRERCARALRLAMGDYTPEDLKYLGDRLGLAAE